MYHEKLENVLCNIYIYIYIYIYIMCVCIIGFSYEENAMHLIIFQTRIILIIWIFLKLGKLGLLKSSLE